MAGSSFVASQNLTAISVFGAQTPSEGPKVLPTLLDFNTFDTYVFDYSNQQRLGKFSMCQTVYIDASGTDTAVTVSFNGTQQAIVAKGRTQGFYSCFAANPFQATISAPGAAAQIPVIFANYPIANAQWATQ